MSALLVHPATGQLATHCSAARRHNPTPVRFVWHHILPQEAGGQTISANLVSLCDTCHYLIHDLLWVLVRDGGSKIGWGRHGGAVHRDLAWRGYQAALAAGVLNRIPHEGGLL